MSSLRLSAQLQQRMVLTPQLRQRIEMLQMTMLEVSELIEQEMVSNPVLEEVLPGEEIREISENILDQNADGSDNSSADSFDGDTINLKTNDERATQNEPDEAYSNESDSNESDSEYSSSDPFEEIDFGREFKDYLDPGYKTQEIEYNPDAPSFEHFLSQKSSLNDHLNWQLTLYDLSAKEKEIAENIIGNLDSDGRLNASIEDICIMSGCSEEKVQKVRKFVLGLEPVGCGAMDVKDCLVAQLDANGEGESLAADLVRNHLEDIQPHRLHHLAKNTGIDIEILNEEINKIRILDPYPGRRYSTDDVVYVAPEVYIEKLEDDYIIYFPDEGTPRLRISQSLNQLVDQKDTSKEAKDFIKEKMRSAIDLLRNIEHRRQTIYRVVECIIDRQRDFLDKGVEYIKPMMLKDVAEDIGMHLSTISRVVNRKYAHTPQGVIELRRFFSEGMMNEDGEEVSTRILKLKIKKLVEEEDTKKPLTDEQIVKILSKDGVKLSRRTIAKYRDQMNIPGSRERKTVI